MLDVLFSKNRCLPCNCFKTSVLEPQSEQDNYNSQMLVGLESTKGVFVVVGFLWFKLKEDLLFNVNHLRSQYSFINIFNS